VSPTAKSFRFVRACVCAVWWGSGNPAKTCVPPLSLFPYGLEVVSLFPYALGAVSLSLEWRCFPFRFEVKSK